MVYYDYDQSEHTFAMNGQTGKVVGKPPLSFGKSCRVVWWHRRDHIDHIKTNRIDYGRWVLVKNKTLKNNSISHHFPSFLPFI